jgi:MoaA/NifB/PqqE/SkfB family radical SAM enzyme
LKKIKINNQESDLANDHQCSGIERNKAKDHSKIYSPYKILKFRDRIEELQQGKKTRPIKVNIRLHGLCNADCSFCHCEMAPDAGGGRVKEDSAPRERDLGTGQGRRGLEFRTEPLLQFFEDFASLGGESVVLTGGEPTIHPDFEIIIAKMNELGLKWGMYTNALLIDRYYDSLKTATWIRVSLDPIFFRSKQKLLPKIRSLSDHGVFVSGSIIICRTANKSITAAQLPDVIEELKKNDIKILRVSPDHYLRQIEKRDLAVQLKKLKKDNKDINIILQGEKYEANNLPIGKPCHYAEFQFRLDCSGFVFPCPSPILGTGTGKYAYGNLYEQSFLEIWENVNPKFVINKDCERFCIHSKKVKLLDYLMDNSGVGHDEFI